VLLVTAFSTIIGYKALHYKTILPKLLLMAVLINFSRTLIGLMIDFSQVVMLTFVNAFSAAAGGNFVTALKLDKMTKLNPDLEVPEKTYDVLSLFIASLLGAVMLCIALSIITIIVMFLVFRIVGLWVLLILSPIAFFALALPDKMKKALLAFTDKFWDKLSTFLIAGPVLAFFLWLTLAVVQNPGAGGAFGETLTSMESKDTLNEQFITAIGSASNIGQFIVAIALLMSGLEFAIKSAGAISPSLGKFAQKVGSGGGPAVHLARGLAKITGRVASVGAKGVDRAFDVKGMVGRKGLAIAQKLPGAPGAAMFAGMTTARGKAVRGKEASIEKNIEGLGMADQMKLHQAGLKSIDPVTRRAHEKAMARKAAAGPGRQVLVDEEYSKLSHVTDEKERKLQAEAKAEGRVSSALQTGRNAALAVGDEKAVTTLDDLIKKNPGRATDFKSALSNAEATYDASKDMGAYVASYGQDAFKTSQGAMAILKAGGGLNADGTVKADSNIMKYLKEKGGGRFDLVNQHAQQVANMTPTERAILAKGMDANATDEEKRAAKGLEGYASRDGYVRLSAIGGAQGGVMIQPNVQVRNEAKIAEAAKRQQAAEGKRKESLPNIPDIEIPGKAAILAAPLIAGEVKDNEAEKLPDIPGTDLSAPEKMKIASATRDIVEDKLDQMRWGEDSKKVFKYNNAGKFEDPIKDNSDFDLAAKKLSHMMGGNPEELTANLSSLDMKPMRANPTGSNPARNILARNIRSTDLSDALRKAKQAGGKIEMEVMEQVQKLVDIKLMEGGKVRRQLIENKVVNENEMKIYESQGASTDEGNKVFEKIKMGGGTGAHALVFDAAQIRKNAEFMAIRKISKHAVQAAEKAKAAAKYAKKSKLGKKYRNL
jgi:hypothetical protein